MRNKNSFIIMMIATSTGLLNITGCNFFNEHKNTAKPETMIQQPDSEKIVSITQEQFQSAGLKLGSIERRELSTLLQVNGIVAIPPQSKISISFPYGGFVRKINVEEGAYVKKGSLLAVLENPEYVDLQENYLKNKNAREYAYKEYERQKELYKADVAAGKAYQKATSEYRSLETSVNALGQKLKMIGIVPETLTAENIRSTINILSPDNGYVTSLGVNMGKYINAQQELLTLDNNQDVHIDLTVYEKNIHQIQIGQEVQFSLPGDNGKMQHARIILAGKEIGTERSIIVHCIPLNKRQYYMPGTYVQAQIKLNNVLSDVLPEEAILRSEGKQYIFVREDKNSHSSYRFKMIPINTGVEENGYVQISVSENTLIPDSSVVIHGAFTLFSVLKNTGEED